MEPLKNDSFGLLIAYVLPGFIGLWGISAFSETLQSWIAANPSETPTIGGFLYVTLASVASGLTLSTIRWMVLDSAHHATGLRRPDWDFLNLRDRSTAFSLLNEQLYRYYQFYGNSTVALVAVLLIRWSASKTEWIDLAIVVAAMLFTVGSRDTLRKYYSRVTELLGT